MTSQQIVVKCSEERMRTYPERIGTYNTKNSACRNAGENVSELDRNVWERLTEVEFTDRTYGNLIERIGT